MEEKIIKITVTGPESTGKSMLSEQLAKHYHTVWVPEYARKYIDTLGHPYEEEDILRIAKGQLNAEQEGLKKANGKLFCDTELIVTKIWSEVRYGRCDPWILKKIEENVYDLFLLCDIDLPWEFDPQREHPDRRRFLFDLYFRELKGRRFPFEVVSGIGPDRLNNAIQIIEKYF